MERNNETTSLARKSINPSRQHICMFSLQPPLQMTAERCSGGKICSQKFSITENIRRIVCLMVSGLTVCDQAL